MKKLLQRIEPTTKICSEICGAQCCRAPGWFALTPEELERIDLLAQELDIEVLIYPRDDGAFVLDHLTNGGTCPFLDEDKLCRIYEHRPQACREFPVKPSPRCLVWPA